MSTIKSVEGREILDSRGNPTVEVEISTENGSVIASVPSGASTGQYEALELRDGDKNRFGGKGVLKAVANVNQKIAPKLIGADPAKQKKLDQIMLELDGTENKSKLGANAVLGVSLAIARAGALAKTIPLYMHLAELGGNSKISLPTPLVLIMEGGKHAEHSSDIQEFMIAPKNGDSLREKIRICGEIYHSVEKLLSENGLSTDVGMEGAFGPSLNSNEKFLETICEGGKRAGREPEKDFVIAIDCAASEFYSDKKYKLEIENKVMDENGLLDFYSNLSAKYPICSIEDGFAENEWNSWKKFLAEMGGKLQIVGDDLTVTNTKRIMQAIDLKTVNAVIIKPNQIGTVTETIEAMNLAKKNGIKTIVSHRSAETEDTFIAELAVGMGSEQCKFGATSRGERIVKYDRLMRIEEELGGRAVLRKL